jgi:alpha-beta hydrolase superfamily lysophospholipase
MQHATSSFKTPNRLQIHSESWLPDSHPKGTKAVVILVHGLADHIGRYPHVAQYLVEHGYAVYGLDHRGHGRSDGLRTYFDDINEAVADLKTYFDGVKAANAGLKIFLYGHSMGSLIALLFALQYQDQLAGVIASGATLNSDTAVSPVMLVLSGILDRLIPKQAVVPPLSSSTLSRDPGVVKAYDNDKLVNRGALRVRMGKTIIDGGRYVRDHAAELRLPMLIMHGSADQLVPPSGSEVLYQRASSKDKTLKMYPGLYHEIHNEPEQKIVLADVAAWLDKH